MCKPCREDGTMYKGFTRALYHIIKHTNLKMEKEIFNPNSNDVKKHLNNNGAVLLLFHWANENEDGDHYILLVGDSGKNIWVVNEECQSPIRQISDRTLRSYLKQFEYVPPKHEKPIDNIYPKAWFIKKN